MPQETFFVYNTPVGRLTIACNGRAITRVSVGDVAFSGVRTPCALTNLAANQLQEYLAGKRRFFDLPLEPEGTEFQQRVWREIADIPYGTTRTYSEIARAVDSPRASRAVGMAANKNPLAIVVPCHRVVGANGTLGGYAYGSQVKRYLLELEKRAN